MAVSTTLKVKHSSRPGRRVISLLAAASALYWPGSPASAAETTTYRYDALGRLVAVNVSGGANSGLANNIGYDAAGNRTQYVVEGAKAASRSPKIIVLPLNGYTIIPLQ